MDFRLPASADKLRLRVQTFMDEEVLPSEAQLHEQSQALTAAGRPWEQRPVIEELKRRAQSEGLWNLFLPGDRGAGLSNLEYAPLAEMMGHSPEIGPEAMNCSAPDTGNMELLELFGTNRQKEKWLQPLLDGRIRSGFCMTEPAVASSDATNIATAIRRVGSEYVISGTKWWTSGAMRPECQLLIVMGKTDPSESPQRQQSMILVGRDTPGVTVNRHLSVFGNDDAVHGGHAQITFDEVRVPVGNLLGEEGAGFAISQARLGPGRVHHCMRAIGMAERALSLLCKRVDERLAFGGPLSEKGVIQGWVAEARLRIEMHRLLVLKAAWLMDTVGNKGAHAEIQAIKIAVPRMAEWVVDRAIQAHGGAGVSQDFPLAMLWRTARMLRIADGPDEVHQMSLGRKELRSQRLNGRADRGFGE